MEIKKIPFEHGLELEDGKDYLIGPPAEIFRDGFTLQELEVEDSIIPVLDTDENNNPLMEVREGQGLFTMLRGHKYPIKGYYWTDKNGGPLHALGQIKKHLICQLRLFSKFKIIFGLVLLLGRRKFIDEFLKEFNRFSMPLLRVYILKPEMYCTFARELEKLIGNFLTNLGFEQRAPEVAFIAMNIVQYDDSYRYMFEDTFDEVNEEQLFKDPGKELLRLVDIVLERRPGSEKFQENLGMLKKILYLFKIKYIRDAFLEALKEANIQNLKMDDIDRYHTLYKGGHNYGGKTGLQRMTEWVDMYNGLPPEMSRVSLKQ